MIKKIVLLIFFLFLPLFTSAQDYSEYEWYIDSYDTVIEIQQNSDLIVTETIKAEFNVYKHGIFRDIPILYYDDYGYKYKLRLDVMEIVDENGDEHMYSENKSGNSVFFKIGDPDVTIIGPQTYIIKYKVERGFRYFDDHDQLYWNAIVDDHDVPILNASANVYIPGSVFIKAEDNITTRCFVDYFGDTNEESCNITQQGQNVLYSTGNLDEYVGMTIVLGIPTGLIHKPTLSEKAFDLFLDNWGFWLPFLFLILLLYLWYTKGRDPHLKGPIIAQYEPPNNLTPSEVGSLIDEKVQLSDITADIIGLAVKGYFKIQEYEVGKIIKSTKYKLIKLKKAKHLKKHESELMEAIFKGKQEVSLDSLKNKFYKEIPRLTNRLYEQMMNYKYFRKNPKNVRAAYYTIGGLMMGVAFPLASFGRFDIVIGIFISGILFMLFAGTMPKRTRKGADDLWHILGLKEFINVAEKYRIQWQEKENIFEELLPYAMVFGIADKWAETFKDIYKQPPEWYESTSGKVFNSMMLYNALNSFQSSSKSILRSAPSQSGSYRSSGSSGFSSGGGFSGGGFGGGSVGSW